MYEYLERNRMTIKDEKYKLHIVIVTFKFICIVLQT
jgi:hypothetical protein